MTSVFKFYLWPAVVGVGLLYCSHSSWALTTLKKVQVTDGAQIDLLFDGKIKESQIKTEYLNDIIQLSLEDVSVYPAKIFSVSGDEITKVFAYQYAPKLVRCRFTVKGNAEQYKNKVRIRYSGKMLTVNLDRAAGPGTGIPESDQVVRSSAQAVRTPPVLDSSANAQNGVAASGAMAGQSVQKAAQQPPPANHNTQKMNDDEKQLLDHVLRGSQKVVEKNPENEKSPLGRKEARESREALGGAKPMPSPFRSLLMLGIVLAIFGGMAFIFKKAKGNSLANSLGGKLLQSGGDQRHLKGMLGKFMKNSFGAKGKMIEVVATHYLGPKKSIAVVKVCGKVLVLGVSNDSINLITQMADAQPEVSDSASLTGFEDLDLEDFIGNGSKASPQFKASGAVAGAAAAAGAVAAGKTSFSDMLGTERTKPSNNPYQPPYQAPYQQQRTPGGSASQSNSSIRAQIKSRVDGMKQL